MVQKTNKPKSRLGREFKGEYIDAPMGEGKAELLDSLVKKARRGFPDWRKKEMFFQHLNNVMATKLVKPSIIIEYVNQYQRGDK